MTAFFFEFRFLVGLAHVVSWVTKETSFTLGASMVAVIFWSCSPIYGGVFFVGIKCAQEVKYG
jgi:hypothetical protein